MKQIRKRLTYANVVATLALFLVVAGGSAFAAGQLAKNSVGSKQIKKNAVTTAKVKKGAITGAKVKNGAITGAKINLSTLGKVPTAARADEATRATSATTAANATAAARATHADDSDKLGGLGPSAYLKGGGASLAGRALLELGSGGDQHILDVPGYGEVVGGCGSGGAAVGFINESGEDLRMIGVAGTEATVVTLANGGASALVPSGAGSAGLTVIQLGSPNYADQDLLTIMVTREAQSGGNCGTQAWAVSG